MRRRLFTARKAHRVGITTASLSLLAALGSCTDATGPVVPASHLDVATRPIGIFPMMPPLEQPLFSDDFRGRPVSCMQDGGTVGSWLVVFTGYGCVSQESGNTGAWMRMQPRAVYDADATSASLVIAPPLDEVLESFDLRLRMITDAQLRQGSAPNPWEVGWVVWQYSDPDHFYYFIAKPNGWELGKRDPAYPGGQRFLATGNAPHYPVGRWYDIRIVQRGAAIEAFVDDQRLVRFTDNESPYLDGRVGVYNEDASTRVADVVVMR